MGGHWKSALGGAYGTLSSSLSYFLILKVT